MDAFMYQAALYCEDCGKKIRRQLEHELSVKCPTEPDDESSYDSDDYPKGPYSNGGGESDAPNHCGSCGEFLENPLTSDGREYVIDAIRRGINGDGNPDVLKLWWEFYDITVDELIGTTK